MRYEDRCFSVAFADRQQDCPWKIMLPLGGSGYLTLGRTSEETAPTLMMVSIERLQQELTAKQKLDTGAPAELKSAA